MFEQKIEKASHILPKLYKAKYTLKEKVLKLQFSG